MVRPARRILGCGLEEEACLRCVLRGTVKQGSSVLEFLSVFNVFSVFIVFFSVLVFLECFSVFKCFYSVLVFL